MQHSKEKKLIKIIIMYSAISNFCCKLNDEDFLNDFREKTNFTIDLFSDNEIIKIKKIFCTKNNDDRETMSIYSQLFDFFISKNIDEKQNIAITRAEEKLLESLKLKQSNKTSKEKKSLSTQNKLKKKRCIDLER